MKNKSESEQPPIKLPSYEKLLVMTSKISAVSLFMKACLQSPNNPKSISKNGVTIEIPSLASMAQDAQKKPMELYKESLMRLWTTIENLKKE